MHTWVLILAPTLVVISQANKYANVCQSTTHLTGIQIMRDSLPLFCILEYTSFFFSKKKKKQGEAVFISVFRNI